MKSFIPYWSAQVGRDTAFVVTLTTDGREVRPRSVKLDQLHLEPIGKNGRARRTGYVLEDAQ